MRSTRSLRSLGRQTRWRVFVARVRGVSRNKKKEILLSSEYIEVGKQYFVGWGTLMLINAVLAQGKNRSGLVWFLVSLILGPIATLILAVLPKLPESQ